MTEYKIQSGDCLSLLAERFGVSVADIQALNSDQILDIDLIYAGDTIDMPGHEAESVIVEPIKVEVGKRDPLPLVPSKRACKADFCKAQTADFVDILYVPAHPVTGEKTWYALTEGAQSAIKKEQALLEQAISSDKNTFINHLNKLGILSKFETTQHEHFLEQKQAERLRELSRMLKVIRSGAAKKFKDDKGNDIGEYGFVTVLAEQESLDPEKLLSRSILWEEFKAFVFNQAIGGAAYNIYKALTQSEEEKENERYTRLVNARYRVKAKVIEHLEEKIEALQKEAIKAAGARDTNDGTRFVYDEKRNYYTSKEQKSVDSYVRRIAERRPHIEKQSMQVDGLKYSHRLWEGISEAAEFIANDTLYKEMNLYDDVPRDMPTWYFFTKALNQLNGYGYLLKEQCLTDAELFGTETDHMGPTILTTYSNGKYKEWRSDSKLTIEAGDRAELVSELIRVLCGEEERGRNEKLIKSVLSTISVPISRWAYYPTRAFIRFIDNTLTKWLSSINNLMGRHPIPDMFSDLVWLKQLAEARIEVLRKHAAERAEQNHDALRYIFIAEDKRPAHFKLIWDEKMHKPAEKKPGIMKNEAGEANLQVVECCLLSQEGKVSWVRGPAWYLPHGKRNKSKGHVKNITKKVGFVNEQLTTESIAQTPSDALEELKKQAKGELTSTKLFNLRVNLSGIIADEYKSSAFWEGDHHWQGGLAGNGHSAYVANAQAQLFRFTSSGLQGDLNATLGDLNQLPSASLDLSAGVSANAQLTLASGQLSFSTWFPTHDAANPKRPEKGHVLKIHYVAGEGMNQLDGIYKAGEFFMHLTATVYGLAAVSCQLSSSLSFGPSETDGGIGVRGKSIKLADPNQAVKSDVIASVNSTIPIAAQAGGSVDMFAGVEVGGMIGAEVLWRPPSPDESTRNKDEPLVLGKISSKMTANLGIGLSAGLRISFHNGTLFWIIHAKAVCGKGASGKFAVALNPVNCDRFVKSLLGVLREKHFKYIEFFGERDENGQNPTFEELNERLTLAFALGLSFAEVMLLPSVAYSEYRNKMDQEEYAPMIARHINCSNIQDKARKREQLAKRRAWIRLAPPETLANLLNCLTVVADKAWFENAGERIKREEDEREKAQAIANIFNWIKPDNDNDDKEIRRSQFEKALTCMGGPLEQARLPAEKWRRFGRSWKRIEEYLLGVTELSDKALAEVSRLIQDQLNPATTILAGNMCGYRLTTAKNHVHYLVYRTEPKEETEQAKKAESEQVKEDRVRLKKAAEALTADPRFQKLDEWKIRS